MDAIFVCVQAPKDFEEFTDDNRLRNSGVLRIIAEDSRKGQIARFRAIWDRPWHLSTMSKHAKQLRVAMAVPQGLAFLERVLRGICDYARENGKWTFTRLPDALGTSIEWLRYWKGDGAFALITRSEDARFAQTLSFPVVNLASHIPDSGVPTVAVDHRLIGELAAAHLIQRRFRRFGYFGTAHLWYSQLRRESFCAAIKRAGCEVQTLEVEAEPHSFGSRNQQQRLMKWVRSLHSPVGIMASTDLRAAMILDACRQIGLRVPDEVGVIGVDNDPVFAEFDDPPLTSVSRNDHQVGLQAAALLENLMAGGKSPPCPVLVAPDQVIQRKSTETLVIEDAVVALAVRYIRDHVDQPFGVEKLLAEVPLSRRGLEYRFRAALGMSPYDYIVTTRIETAMRMLQHPQEVKISSVSKACGFTDPRCFRATFRRLVKISPVQYRQDAINKLSGRP